MADVTPGGEVPNEGPRILAVVISLSIVTTVLVVCRLWHRHHIAQLGLDDLCAVIAWVFSMGHSINDIIAVVLFGYGKHEVDLPLDVKNSHGALLGFWISQLFTKPSILFSRLAFCFLYLRIFNGLGKQRRQIIYLVMTLISLYYTIAFIVTAFFNCQPIKKNWLKATPGTCINQAAFIYTNAAMNIFIDALVVALPIPDIINMQRNRAMIAWGTAILAIPSILTSILRIPTLGPAASGAAAGDTSWFVTESTIWTVAEMNVPIMASCIVVLVKPISGFLKPALRHIPGYQSTGLSNSNNRTGQKYGTGYRNGWSKAPGVSMNSVTVKTAKYSSEDELGILSKNDGSVNSARARGAKYDSEDESGSCDYKHGITRTVVVDIESEPRESPHEKSQNENR